MPAPQGTLTTADLTQRLQSHFSKKLLDHAIQAIVLNQFAVFSDLPKKAGAKTVTFFRRAKADAANVQTLTEGVPINVFNKVTYERIDVALAQVGEAAKISDITTYVDLLNALQNSIEMMGEDAALFADQLTRNEVVTNITASGQRRYAGGASNFSGLSALSADDGKAQVPDFLDCATRLKLRRAPQIGGFYVGIVPPQVSRDLMRDDEWQKASQYGAVTQIFKGEVGKIFGVRFIETTVPFRENSTQNTYADGGPILTSIVTGRGAYGVTRLAGDSPVSPRVMISDKPDKADPLNQFLIAGWKAYYGTKLLNNEWVCTLRSKTAYTE